MEGGDDIFHYCILVCTNAEIELQKFSLDEFLNEMRKDNRFGSFLDKIDERVVAVNNKTKSPEEKERNREAIIALVDKVVEENRKQGRAETCSNELFKQADKLHKTLVNKYRCHPIILNAVIEATIKLTNSILRPNQTKFMSEVKTILQKNELCKFDQKTQKFILTNDGKCIEVSYDTFEQDISLIFSETRESMASLFQFSSDDIGNSALITAIKYVSICFACAAVYLICKHTPLISTSYHTFLSVTSFVNTKITDFIISPLEACVDRLLYFYR